MAEILDPRINFQLPPPAVQELQVIRVMLEAIFRKLCGDTEEDILRDMGFGLKRATDPEDDSPDG